MDTIENLRYWLKRRNETPVNSHEFKAIQAQVQKYEAMRRLELRDKPELFPKAIKFEIGLPCSGKKLAATLGV